MGRGDSAPISAGPVQANPHSSDDARNRTVPARVRAKRKIREAGIPYRVPAAPLLPERTASVLGVVYLLFNEGYAATEGADPVRVGLCAEAIRLARVLHGLMPADAEVAGLLGRREEAARAYRAALDLARAEPDRRFLARRLDEVRRAE